MIRSSVSLSWDSRIKRFPRQYRSANILIWRTGPIYRERRLRAADAFLQAAAHEKAAVCFLIDFFIVNMFSPHSVKFYCSRNCFFSGVVNSNFKFTDRQNMI